MAGSVFGMGTPITYATSPLIPWGLSPYGAQTMPLSSAISANPYTVQPLQQILQLLQAVPQQLQQLQQLEYLQQQQLHQLLQVIPAQFVQLQQLIQAVLQQAQQPFGQAAGTSGFAVTPPWGIAPQLGPVM